MSKSLLRFSGIAFLTACLCVRSAIGGIVIPIAAMVEWPQEIMLLIESEMKRWNHEAGKYKEMLYAEMMGRVGGASLPEDNNVLKELTKAAKDGASSIGNTNVALKAVSDLSNYATAKGALTSNYIIQAKKGIEYSEKQLKEITENQRVAINDLAEAGLAYAASQNVGASIGKGDSVPDKRSQDIADAKDVTAMYEMMLAQNRKIYERSLRSSAIEATKAGIISMQGLSDISKAAIGKEGV